MEAFKGKAMEAKKVKRGEVVLDEDFCTGCGYCVAACKRGCIEITGEKIDARGLLLPTLVKPEKCNACGNCAIVCAGFAIEVYALPAS